VYFGFAISVLLHAGLLAWALVNISSTPPFKIGGPEPVEVALITDEDLVRLKKGSRRSKLLESKQAESQEGKAEKPVKNPKAAPPPPPESSEPPPPEPASSEPKPDPIAAKIAALAKPEAAKPEPPKPDPAELAMLQRKKQAEAEAKAKAEAEARKKADDEAKKKAEAERKRKLAEARKKREAERKKRLEQQKKLAEKRRKDEERRKQAEAKKKPKNWDDVLKGLADNDPTRKAAAGGAAEPPKTATSNRGATAGAEEGVDDRNTSSQRLMIGLLLKTAVSKCWSINTGAEGIQNIVVQVDIKLRPDGHLASEPALVTRGRGPLFQDVANAAKRAVIGCAPYDLPQKYYKGGWDYVRLTFDPRKMY
jgi:colicin import membrane protein